MAAPASDASWANLSRLLEVPEWAIADLKHHRENLRTFLAEDAAPSITMMATIDWRSLSLSGADAPTIKIDWTLLEFFLLSEHLQQGHLADLTSSKIFDDRFGSAIFAEYDAPQTALIGELSRILCWKAIQKDNYAAAIFFYQRFMAYCASDQPAIQRYTQALRDETPAGRAALGFLIGHEFAHFCLERPECLSPTGAKAASAHMAVEELENAEDALIRMMSRKRVDRKLLQRVLSSPFAKTLIPEIWCDQISAMCMLELEDAPDLRSLKVLLSRIASHVNMIHLIGWISILEIALFAQDGGEPDFATLAEFNSVRSYVFGQGALHGFSTFAFHLGPDAVTFFNGLDAASWSYTSWLDRTLGLFLEKVIGWRFQLEAMEAESFWRAEHIETVIEHLRRYPNFVPADFEAATRIATSMPRGWHMAENF